MIWDDRNWDLIDKNAKYNGDFVTVRKLFVRVAVNVSDKFIWIQKKSEYRIRIMYFRHPKRIQSVRYVVKLKNSAEYRIFT